MGGDTEPYKPVHETAADSGTGEEQAWCGAVLVESRHRPGMDAGGLSADPQEWCARHRWSRRCEYESNLEANLQSLLDSIRSGSYKAPPVRRAYIPKADGTQRPLGIPTFEDKVAQRAISMVLEAIYEQDFYPCSYGFRPGRSAHQALQSLRTGFMTQGLRWVLDVDIRKYFDSIPHKQLREFLDRRVTDGVIRRMIDKWLKAGVMEEGQLRQSTEGSPQGGVITPLTQKVI